MTTLAGLLARVEEGERLPADPWLPLVPAPPDGNAAVVSFPGHVVIAADLDPEWIRAQLPDGDLSAPLNPPFLRACERKLGLRVNNLYGLYLAPIRITGNGVSAVPSPPRPVTSYRSRARSGRRSRPATPRAYGRSWRPGSGRSAPRRYWCPERRRSHSPPGMTSTMSSSTTAVPSLRMVCARSPG